MRNTKPDEKPRLTEEELLFLLNPGQHPALSQPVKRALDEVISGPGYEGMDPAKAFAKALVFLVKNRPGVFTDKLDDRVALKAWTAMYDDNGEARKQPLTDRFGFPGCTITVRSLPIPPEPPARG